MAQWHEFPHDATPFDYSGDRLASAWPDLHAGDCEPWPDADRAAELLAAGLPGAPEADTLAQQLQDAWRAFHRGDFETAVSLADSLQGAGHAAANKGAGIYADYLVDDEDERAEIYQACVRRAESAIGLWPEDANAHYFHAFALGRYSQCISIAKALAQGLGGKVKASLVRTLELAPDHAEAHTAMGLYHAEIIDKVGKLVGRMTYGANADTALEHFERALELTPEAPIAHIEYGNGLYLLFGDDRLDDSNAAYESAAAIEPKDAMQKLDVEYARESMA